MIASLYRPEAPGIISRRFVVSQEGLWRNEERHRPSKPQMKRFGSLQMLANLLAVGAARTLVRQHSYAQALGGL